MQKEGLEEIEELILKLKNQNVPIPEAECEIKKLYKKRDFDWGITLYNSLSSDYKLWGKINMSWPNANTFGSTYEVKHPKTKKPVKIPDRGWRWKIETFNDAVGIVDGEYQNITELHDASFICGRIWFSKDKNTRPSSITYFDEVESFLLISILSSKSDGGIELEELKNKQNLFGSAENNSGNSKNLKNSDSSGLGFKVNKLQKSNFPRVEYAPDPEKSEAENIELLKKYIRDKEAQLVTAFNKDELITVILIKNGFKLNYTLTKQEAFKQNEILLASDPAISGTGSVKETLICLDVSIADETVEHFKTHTDQKINCTGTCFGHHQKMEFETRYGR